MSQIPAHRFQTHIRGLGDHSAAVHLTLVTDPPVVVEAKAGGVQVVGVAHPAVGVLPHRCRHPTPAAVVAPRGRDRRPSRRRKSEP